MVLLPCMLIELSAGSIFGRMEEYLKILPGVLVMIPPLLALRGNINGAMASRIGTALHTGVIDPGLRWTRELKVNVLSSIVLTLIASATIGILAFLSCTLTGVRTIGFLKFLEIATLGAVLSGVILSLVTVLVAVESYVRGLDPDNVTAPLMATVGDLVTIGCIFFVVVLVV